MRVYTGQPLSVSLNGVFAGYNGKAIIADITLDIAPGDFVGVIGPNGSGKSTLLKVIVGLITPWQGKARISGDSPEKARKRIGYLPQLTQIDFGFPANDFDVVMMGRYGNLGFCKRPGKADKEAVDAAIARVGLSEKQMAPIGELSGGQRQRAFIARAIAQEPDLLVLDEPITGVDLSTQHALSGLLEELNKAGVTIISTTHDLNCAASSFNKVVCLNNRLVAQGSPEQTLTPQILNETYGSHLLVADNCGAEALHAHHEDSTRTDPTNQ